MDQRNVAVVLSGDCRAPVFGLRRRALVAACVAGFSLGQVAHAAVEVAAPADIQRRQNQQAESIRDQANSRPDVFTDSQASAAQDDEIPQDAACFDIVRVQASSPEFPWLEQWLRQAEGRCIGRNGLLWLQRHANDALIQRGYITSRVLLPGQTLSGGVLTFDIVAGRVAAIEVASEGEGEDGGEAPAPQRLARAMAMSAGDLLNQRDVDQGLENLRRLVGQSDATIDIVPGDAFAQSIVRIHPGTGRRVQAGLGADNLGLDATGKYQLAGTLSIESPLGLADQLQVWAGANADYGAGKGNLSYGGNWNVPFGYGSLFVGATRARYQQTLSLASMPFVYRGTSSEVTAGASRVVFRNSTARTQVSARVYRRIYRNYLADAELAVQHQDVTGFELSATHRQYFSTAGVMGTVSWRQNFAGLSAVPGMAPGIGVTPALQALTGTLIAYVPLTLAGHKTAYQMTWTGQYGRTRMTANDFFPIGTRATVRGFDGQTTLAAESGFAVQNELQLPLHGQTAFAGVDFGKVSGPSARNLSGTSLAGAVVGVRGQIDRPGPAALSYEISLGMPLSRPATFSTHKPVLLAQLSGQF
ncbi:ShlB/FhaC/HecB family hemolysin secretion/activation protein [Paraburkholderia sartisoli]|uniref:ShlB/FhaC/HecB family hemolysin secretion/activation protein n=1 Tax=Paraburkholderia sartisoli TaxID=83784 RepID=UPI000B882476|nr:ShlB/FhaC/HecB family hemolysin secretion/activation protein [Paraburkholderia sartisoli]